MSFTPRHGVAEQRPTRNLVPEMQAERPEHTQRLRLPQCTPEAAEGTQRAAQRLLCTRGVGADRRTARVGKDGVQGEW